MSKNFKSFEVKHGSRVVKVFPWLNTSKGKWMWRFEWVDENGQRKATVRVKKEAAREAAKVVAIRLEKREMYLVERGTKERALLAEVMRVLKGPEELREFLRWKASKTDGRKLGAVVTEFLRFKVDEAGGETAHIRQMKRDLTALSARLGEEVMELVEKEQLVGWWDERAGEAGAARRKGVRTTLVQLWRWAKRQGYLVAEVPEAEKLNPVKVEAGSLEVPTVEELKGMLEAVETRWRPWVVLGAFGGLRPEEIAPQSKEKRGLLCQEIDWEDGGIRVPAVVAKTNRPRWVPLSDCLREWLVWAGIGPGKVGPVCETSPSSARALGKLAKAIGRDKWPKDWLRHGYGTARNAELRSLGQVAEEMGTSVEMLHRHYHNPRSRQFGEMWFELRPSPKAPLKVYGKGMLVEAVNLAVEEVSGKRKSP